MDENQKEIEAVLEDTEAVLPEEDTHENQETEVQAPAEPPVMEQTVVFKPPVEPDYPSMVAAMTEPVKPRPMFPSEFEGTGFQVFGIWLAGFFLTVLTLGIAYPWALCMYWRWEARHTVINGKHLSFDGRGSQLVCSWLLWVLFSILTLGLYSFRAKANLNKWRYSHTRVAGTRRQNPDPTATWKIVAAIAAAVLVLCLLGGLLWAVLTNGAFTPFWNRETTPQPAETTTQPTETTTEPIVTTTEPTVPETTVPETTVPPTQPPEPVYRYRVTARGGLRLRAETSVNSKVLAMIPHNTLLTPIEWKGNWAKVQYDGKTGWCSGDYLKLDEEASTIPEVTIPEGVYTLDQVNEAKEKANGVIRSYKGKTPENGRATLEAKDAQAFYEEAEKTYSHWLWFAGQFDTQVEMLEIYDSSELVAPYLQVEDDRFHTVEDLCDYYYSLFTDDLAASMLMNNVFELDGKLYASGVRTETEGVYDSHWFDVSESGGEIFVTLHVKENRNGKQTQWDRTHRCFIEDGVWVFESVCMIYT